MVGRDRLVSGLGVLVLLAFAGSLGLGFISPIYYDDARNAIGNLRGGYDGWGAVNVLPYCGLSFFVPFPVMFLPGRFLAWLAQVPVDDYMGLRANALLILLVWLGYMVWFLKRHLYTQWPWLWCAGLVAGVCSAGTMPMMLFQSRPDVGLLCVVTLLVTLPLVCRGQVWTGRRQALVGAGLVVMLSWYFSAHPKTILYAPLAFASIGFLPFGKRGRIAMVLLVGLLVVQSLMHWQQRLYCPDDKRVQTMRETQAITPGMIMGKVNRQMDSFFDKNRGYERMMFDAANGLDEPGLPLLMMLRYGLLMTVAGVLFLVPACVHFGLVLAFNFLHIHMYVRRMLFGVGVKWRILPDDTLASTLVDSAFSLLVLGAVIMLLRALIVFVRSAGKREFLAPGVLLPGLLLLGMLAQAGVQIAKNFYESPFIWPCLFLFFVMVAAWPMWRAAFVARQRRVLITIFIMSLCSQALLLTVFVPVTFAAYAAADQNGVLSGNEVLMSPFDYKAVAANVHGVAGQCGFADDANTKRVMVDHVTYMAMKHTSQPLMYRVSFRNEVPDTAEGMAAMLRKREGAGVVMQCRYVPEEWLGKAKQDHGFCCLKTGDLDITDAAP